MCGVGVAPWLPCAARGWGGRVACALLGVSHRASVPDTPPRATRLWSRFQTRDDWLGVKESGHFAFNQVPGLRWCEDRSDDAECFDLVQSHTIMRFLARKHGAYLDESQRHWVDLVADGAEDFKSRLSKLVYSEDGPEKLQGACCGASPRCAGWLRVEVATDPGAWRGWCAQQSSGYACANTAKVYLVVLVLTGDRVRRAWPQITWKRRLASGWDSSSA